MITDQQLSSLMNLEAAVLYHNEQSRSTRPVKPITERQLEDLLGIARDHEGPVDIA